MSEHIIIVEALHRYSGSFDRGMVGSETMMDLQFEEEVKIKYECVCGQKFRKRHTAVEHLQEEYE